MEWKKYHYTVFIGSLMCQLWIIAAKSNANYNYYVPSHVKPGHIITMISHEEPDTRCRIHSSLNFEGDLHKYFTVLNNGALITTSNITSLKGLTISLFIQNESPNRHWKEIHNVKIGTPTPEVHFSDNPYFAIVSENAPVASQVMGINNLVKSVQHFPVNCKVILHSGDVKFFKLSNDQQKKLEIVSTEEFDREARASYYVVIQASCPHQPTAYAQVHVGVSDVNDNAPEFGLDVYSVSLSVQNMDGNEGLLQVEAFDADYANDISYSISGTDLFKIHPKIGTITVKNPRNLESGTSYEFKAYARDQDGLTSKPAIVRITIKEAIIIEEFIFEDEIVSVQKRDLQDDRIFIVRNTQYGDMFTVASVPPVPEERFYFSDPAPTGLILDEVTGMVSTDVGYTWNDTDVNFFVNISRTDDPDFQDDMQVIVYIISTSWEAPIFRNEPKPLWARIPMWIRPDTTVYTLNSDIAQMYNAPVQYQIESGAEDHFSIDPSTGEVKISWRGQFTAGYIYQLSVSAQSVGTAPRIDTPSQILHVQVEDVNPQFYELPYIINMNETTNEGERIALIRAVSFQELSLTFSWVFENSDDAARFELNPTTGEVTLTQALEYIRMDRVQYRMTVTAVEEISNLQSEVEVIINLVAENLHEPFFPPTHYVQVNISENVVNNTKILEVLAVDLDAGDFGLMDFTVLHPNFIIETTDGKTGVLKTIGELDYDYIGPEHMYEFIIVATDRDPVNPKSGTATVQVWMTNENDEAPEFFPPNPVIYLTENTDAGVDFIHVAQAYDPDGFDITFKFTDCYDGSSPEGQTCAIFDIDENSGQIKLNTNVPVGIGNQILKVVASDSTAPSEQTIGEIRVDFIGVNHPPAFPNCADYFGTAIIYENEPIGTSIINVTVADDDSGENGQMDITIVYDYTLPDFFSVRQVDDYTAELYSLVVFDRENAGDGVVVYGGKVNYRVTVEVTDRGRPLLSSTCFFFVEIMDINDNDPKFDYGPAYEVTIDINTSIGTEFIRVWAIDDDEGSNANVTYSISNQNMDCGGSICFGINGATGWIILQNQLPIDLPIIEIEIEAKDNGSPRMSTFIPVWVTLTSSAAALPPIWDDVNGQRIDDVTSVIVPENAPINTVLDIFLRTTTPGGTDQVTYYLIEGRTKAENADRDFLGFPNSTDNYYEVAVASYLDNYITADYILKLRSSRKSSTSVYTDARLKVTVTDVNDKIPWFQGLASTGKYPAAVSDETIVGEHVVTVMAIDLDSTSPNNEITYSWADTCGQPCTKFALDPMTGEITAADTFDTLTDEYQLLVVAEDGAPSSLPGTGGRHNRETAEIIVRVLKPSTGSPEFSDGRYDFIIDEGQPLKTNIANVTASDPDPEFNYPQYIISAGNENHVFAVMGETGEIYTTGDLLYAEKQDYVLTYNVFDGRYIRSTEVVVNLTSINMYPPFFVKTVYESLPRVEHDPNGIPALLTQDPTASDQDVDRPGTIEYSLEGALVTGTNFQIKQNGSVSLYDPNIDRDYPDGYANWQINLVATDEAGVNLRKGYAILNIRLEDINDNSPIFDISSIEGEVLENSPSGTTVLQLSANDYDTGVNATIVYEAVDIPQNDSKPLFDVSTDGWVTTLEPIDREVVDHYTLVVRAKDEGIPPRYSEVNQTIYITITDANDNNPYFDPPSYIFDMPEEIPVGGSVNYVQGVDLDIDDNGKLSFVVIGGADANYFYMDSIYVGKTGVIKIKEVIDYESLPAGKSLTFEVEVSDPDNVGSNSPATVIIFVQDINDNAPILVPNIENVTIAEHVALGTEVITFTATDPDEGDNAIFSFYIDYENTDPEKKFSIGSDSGIVTVRGDLDREVTPEYTVHILAIDEGIPPMTGTATLYVTLSDINDHAPDFPPDMPDLVVGDTTLIGDVVVTFTAIDLDLPENGPPFDIVKCTEVFCDDFNFEMEGTTGGKLTANLNGYNRIALNRKYYDLTFTMTDNPTSGEQAMSAERTLRVTIESNNDHEMIPEGSEKTVVIYNYMKEFKNVACGNVYVNDQDDWDLPDKTFTCVGGCQMEVEGTMEYYFNVSSNEGEIYMLEGAPKGNHRLSVEVNDQNRAQTITAFVNVKVVYLEEKAVMSSGSMRLQDITTQEFIIRTDSVSTSKIELFRNSLAGLLGQDSNTVDVFTVIAVQGEARMIDVQFSANVPPDSPYYTSARMNGLVWTNKADIEAAAGINIYSAPVDLCLIEGCFNGGCTNRMLAETQPFLTNTNTTSYVGVNTTFEFECACQSVLYDDTPPICEAYTCMNDGICTENWNGFDCECQDGFEGPRCQNTKISFDGNSWAWFDTLGTTQCSDFRLSFEIITSETDGLILYNGPMTMEADALGIKDYISIELEAGQAKARMDIGDGDVMFKVDGPGSKMLNDEQWHSIEIIKESKTVRLIVDHCDNSVLDESVNSTIDIRTSCEASATFTGDQFLLNVHTPLELGSRAVPDVDYPAGITGVGFNGCLKNLMYVDKIYDLELSRTESSGSPSNGCDRELGCSAAATTTCPPDSTCIGNFIDETNLCVCDLGLKGPNCDIETTTKDFDGNPSFIEWALKPAFNSSLDPKALEIWLQFRTRTSDGMLFTASSFSTLEFIKIEVVGTNLQVRFDLGSDIRDLQLTYVNVSDGIWHDAYVTRYGNQVILKLDHGEGKYYNETIPNDEHQLIYLEETRQTFGGAEVYYKKYHETPVVTQMLISSCVRDYRINRVDYFPLDPDTDVSDVADIVQNPGMIDGCDSNACDGMVCPDLQNCTDGWRMPFCTCPPGQIFDPVYICVPIVDCSIPRCVFGDCVTINGYWRCNCWPGYTGDICDSAGAVVTSLVVSLSTGAMISIVLCLLILLLLLLIILFCLQKEKNGQLLLDPNNDTRENVMYYNEEGAGEEDMHAFDLSRLQKPVDPDHAVMSAAHLNDYSRSRDVTRLVTSSSHSMSAANMASSANMNEAGGMAADGMAAGGMSAGGMSAGHDNEAFAMIASDANGGAMSGGTGGMMSRTSMSVTRRQYMSSGQGGSSVNVFINDRMYDADIDPNVPPFDSVREYEYEGGDSSAGSLSTIQTSSSGDLDFNYLSDYGPQFQKLADLYGYEQDGEGNNV